ncbi:hypothetical protein ACGFNP_08665 [Nonomuraea sp. NPDC049269]|uniref:hypothetical protein n=1 Tax=Nonomuraea sp. NPDC049269 TaxID=3364349 RepID=UPI003716A0DD
MGEGPRVVRVLAGWPPQVVVALASVDGGRWPPTRMTYRWTSSTPNGKGRHVIWPAWRSSLCWMSPAGHGAEEARGADREPRQ